MPHRQSLSYAAALAVVCLASPVGAVVVIEGSVLPSAPSGVFGNLPEGFADFNGDGINDWINIGGNRVFSTGTRFDDPDGTQFGSVPWNDPGLWVDYDTEQDILVGEAFSSGSLTINGGSALRYQHLVIGHASDESTFNTTLEPYVSGQSRFELTTDLANTMLPGSGGSGTVIITGPGSVFNNDPNVIPPELQIDLQVAQNVGTMDPSAISDPIYDLEMNLATTSVFGTIDPTIREDGPQSGYDVVVGATGAGVLQITNGGRAEIQDSLMAGVAQSSVGSVIVDGFGSSLVAFGRNELGENIINVANDTTSFVGGRGAGSLTVRNLGKAEFRNGLSIGAPTGEIETATNTPLTGIGQGSGVVQVSDFGTRLDAYASSLADFTATANSTDSGPTVLALAVGETRAGALDSPNTEPNLQPGTLEITAGGTVNVLFSAAYSTDDVDANAAIGPSGQVLLRDGNFLIGNRLIHDGNLNGYGLVRARLLDTSVDSVIAGGDPGAQNTVPSDPLRLVLLGPSLAPGDPGAGFVQTAMTHRGVVEGEIDLQATGGIVNEGTFEASGELNATAITTTVTSRIVGIESTGAPLRVRLSSTAPVSTIPDMAMTAFGPAFQNNGLLAGAIDLVTAGGLANGEDQTTAMTPENSNGGLIRVNGRLQVGMFINHRFGQVVVEPGTTTSIIATGPEDVLPGVVLEDGIDSRPGLPDGIAEDASGFTMANLGTITVNGGTFEASLLQDERPVEDAQINHARLFRNARAVPATSMSPSDNSVGTIVSNNGTLRLGEGVYNTGVMAFTGGDNVVTGQVFNAGPIDYGLSGTTFPGVIQTSGDSTTVTFVDHVQNDGTISIGPNDNEIIFLNGLTSTGPSTIALSENVTSLGISDSAYLTVAGEANLMGGALALEFATVPVGTALGGGTSLTVIDADTLGAGSRFTALSLPLLGAGLFWDVVYDTGAGDVRLEIIASGAIGADFNDDGIVDDADVAVWLANVGLTMGASIIQGDADGDGDVDLLDFDIIQDQLGGAPVAVPAFAVPEPASLLLLAFAAAAASARRRV